MAELSLTGYRYSVYSRVVRMGWHEMGLSADWVEADPFAEPGHAGLSPFGRVPVLRHGDFTLYETSAIMLYLNGISGASLVPIEPRALARMQQVIGIVDAYGYRCLVRQVFSQAVFNPAFDEPADPAEINAGLKAARPVLTALEAIAQEGLQLGDRLSLADLHLAPMIACFDMAPPGRDMLSAHPFLTAWFRRIEQRSSFRATRPPAPF